LFGFKVLLPQADAPARAVVVTIGAATGGGSR